MPIISDIEINKRKAPPANCSGNQYVARWRQKSPGLTASKKQRIFVSHDYMDLCDEQAFNNDLQWVKRNEIKTKRKQAFAFKLHKSLEDAEKDGLTHVFSWLSHGRAFKIHNRHLFITLIMPQYLGMTNYKSFLRQCAIYNFRRLTQASGVESSDACYHQGFLRERVFLCQRIKRSSVKGTVIRPAARFDQEPDFFTMPSLSAVELFEGRSFVQLTDDEQTMSADDDNVDIVDEAILAADLFGEEPHFSSVPVDGVPPSFQMILPEFKNNSFEGIPLQADETLALGHSARKGETKKKNFDSGSSLGRVSLFAVCPGLVNDGNNHDEFESFVTELCQL